MMNDNEISPYPISPYQVAPDNVLKVDRSGGKATPWLFQEELFRFLAKYRHTSISITQTDTHISFVAKP